MGEAEKTGSEKETVKSPENGDIPVWSGRLKQMRTFFEEAIRLK